MQKFEEAIQDYTQAISLDKSASAYSFNRGRCLNSLGRQKEALEDFTEAIKKDHTNPLIYGSRGLIHRQLGNFQEAVEDYTNEIRNSQCFSLQGHINRAYCNAKLKNYDLAIKDYTKIIKANPKSANAYHNRGISYQRKGDFIQVDFAFIINIF